METITISSKLNFPEHIIVDGIVFHCVKNQQGEQTFAALEKGRKIDQSPTYVQALLKGVSYRDLPLEIRINNKPFSRKVGTYYVPKYATIDELARFFDSVAPIYHKIVLTEATKAIISLLLRAVIPKDEDAATILDFGVGVGLSTEVVREEYSAKSIHLCGVDISSKMVAISKQKGIEAHKIDGFNTPFPNDYFDGVFASFVAHYLQSFEPFSEMCRVLKSRGVLAFNLRRPPENWQQHYKSKLEEVGFCNFSWCSGSIKLQSDGTVYPKGYPYTIVQVEKP